MMAETSKISNFAAEALNVVSKIIHKKGVFVVFQLSDEAMALGTVDGTALKAEWSGDVKAHMSEVVDSVKKKLDLENKDMQAKIEKFLDLAVEGAQVLSSAVSFVEKVKASV